MAPGQGGQSQKHLWTGAGPNAAVGAGSQPSTVTTQVPPGQGGSAMTTTKTVNLSAAIPAVNLSAGIGGGLGAAPVYNPYAPAGGGSCSAGILIKILEILTFWNLRGTHYFPLIKLSNCICPSPLKLHDPAFG